MAAQHAQADARLLAGIRACVTVYQGWDRIGIDELAGVEMAGFWGALAAEKVGNKLRHTTACLVCPVFCASPLSISPT